MDLFIDHTVYVGTACSLVKLCNLVDQFSHMYFLYSSVNEMYVFDHHEVSTLTRLLVNIVLFWQKTFLQ